MRPLMHAGCTESPESNPRGLQAFSIRTCHDLEPSRLQHPVHAVIVEYEGRKGHMEDHGLFFIRREIHLPDPAQTLFPWNDNAIAQSAQPIISYNYGISRWNQIRKKCLFLPIAFNGIQRNVDHPVLPTIVGHGGSKAFDIGVLAVECLEGFRLKVFLRFHFHGYSRCKSTW